MPWLDVFTSSHCELPYQLPLLISLRSGIKSQSIVETIFLTFYGRNMKKVIILFLLFLCANSFSEEITDGYKRSSENQPSEQMTRLPLIRNTANLKNTSGYEFLAWWTIVIRWFQVIDVQLSWQQALYEKSWILARNDTC